MFWCSFSHGDSDSGKYANWVASHWPDENQQLLNWQWQEKVIPFWQKEAQFAQEHGVRSGLEMFAVVLGVAAAGYIVGDLVMRWL